MNKTTSIAALIAGFALVGSAAVQAQTIPPSLQPKPKPTPSPSPSNAERPGFVSINAGAQTQAREFRHATSFSLFNETAQVAANQTVNGGFVFDASAGYRVWRRLAVALGVSTVHARGDAALAASIPTAVPNRPAGLTATYSKLRQNDVAVNLLAVWTMPVTGQIDVSVVLGPSFIHVTQDLPTIVVTNGVATAVTDTQSANTAKAGTAGLDISYKLTDRARVGVFGRYAGGEVDLPSVARLKVGGAQFGGGVRWRF